MKRNLILWLAVLGGPVIWFASFCANFALAPWACTLGWKPALFAVSFAALLLTVIAGLAGWQQWQQWQHFGRDFPGEAAGAAPRSRALASGAVLLGALFFLVIVAQLLAEAILGACQ